MLRKVNIILHLVLLLVVVLMFRQSPYFITFIVLICSSYFIILSAGVFFLKLNYFTKNAIKLNSEEVLLTFDDGTDRTNTPKVLDILKQHNVKAIFFVIGNKIKGNEDIVKRMIDEGHVIGNHTNSHPHTFAFLSTQKVINEIEECDNIIKSITNSEIDYFRPPIGYTNPKIGKGIKATSKKIIGWNFRSYDSILKSPERLLNRALKGTKKGDIVLFHDNLTQTTEMLDAFISKSKENGMVFVNSLENKIEI